MPASAPGGAPGREPGSAPRHPAGLLLLLTGDPALRRRLTQLARDSGLAITEATAAAAGPGGEPSAAVIDLGRADALDQVRDWRERWPRTLLAGYLALPDRERWVAAQRAGCDLVTNRGALALRLREALARRGEAGARTFPLFDAADAAGRLGLVYRAAETPAGPVAVYRVDGRLRAVADVCPHAGALLSGGEADGGVITCPGHGSRFDLCSGERLRGPADTGIAVYPLTEESGQVCLLLRSW